MIEVTNEELKNMEYISSGAFGKVYKKNDCIAYKIYRQEISDKFYGTSHPNPMLTKPLFRFNILASRSKNFKYNGGILDLIFLEGKFAGVAIPYYDGEILSNLVDMPLKEKIAISRDLVKESKELSHHFIFPTDYKLNNIILSDDMVHLIDLDDIKTHVCFTPNIFFKSISINALAETIQSFLKQYQHLYISSKISKLLEIDQSFPAINYQKILDYLDKKDKEINVVFLSKNSDFQVLAKIANEHSLKTVLVIDNHTDEEEIIRIIYFLKSLNVNLYDIVLTEKMNNYYNIENIDEAYSLIGNTPTLKKVYKRS